MRLFVACLSLLGGMTGQALFGQTDTSQPPPTLANTQPLEMAGDITSELVDAADRFLLKQLAAAPALRDKSAGAMQGLSTAAPEVARRQAAQAALLTGDKDSNSSAATNDNVEARVELARIIGMRDARIAKPALTVELPVFDGSLLRLASYYAKLPGRGVVYRVRWPVHEDVDAEGLWVPRALLWSSVQRVPQGQPPQPPPQRVRFHAVIIPDAGQTPEHLIGVSDGAERVLPLAGVLAAMGGEVIVTTPVSRHREARRGRAVMTDQEFLYRSSFDLGRHVLGYQVQETLAAVEALQSLPTGPPMNDGVGQPTQNPTGEATSGQAKGKLPMLVFGWGEGGWVALHAAALSSRIDAVCVSGHFQARENVWQEPIHRNLHGSLLNFGDAELAAMIAPRKIVIDAVPGPQVDIPGEGGAPGKLTGPSIEAASAEFERTQTILKRKQMQHNAHLIKPAIVPTLEGPSTEAIETMLSIARDMTPGGEASEIASVEKVIADQLAKKTSVVGPAITAQARRESMLKKWDRFTQRRLEYAADERAEYWKLLKTDSLDNFKTSVEAYRQAFSEDVIGRWDIPLAAPRPRTRLAYNTDKVVGYDVVMDLFEGTETFAYGVLLLPKSKEPSKDRPCVVFQHGLEGRPQDCITGDHPAYHDVAMKLAERGFVVFAPQNLYIFHDRFRTLQRKSNPLGKSLFSIIIPSHQQICRWLASLEEVDGSRMGFYGLSYGGKSAMRIPPLVPEYNLSICSADFNDWVWKNASTHAPHSYVWTPEYEIFEFDLGSRFNYAEMATLMAPRPFMVERGHFDGVAPDDRVAAEFAKIRHLYSALLKLEDKVELEWFVGPHTINGQGTYDFLHKHLKLPK